jgi:hypothetical protein
MKHCKMATITESNELTEQKTVADHEANSSEFDPCSTASIVSPFYLYRHDSPRPSFDVNKRGCDSQVSLKELESGMTSISPSISQEKRDAQATDNATGMQKLMFWKQRKQSRCLIQPKQRGCAWLSRLPKQTKLLVKIVIALLIVGAAVGIAVGVSVHVGGGVYKSNNQTSDIG